MTGSNDRAAIIAGSKIDRSNLEKLLDSLEANGLVENGECPRIIFWVAESKDIDK